MKKTIFIIFCSIIFIPSVFSLSNQEKENIESTLNNILDNIKSIKTSQTSINNKLVKKYPIGSIYITITNKNPEGILGYGEWELYSKGRTLVGMGNNGTTNYTTVNATGGSSSKTLTKENLPSHRHTYTAKGSVSSTFTGSSVSVSIGDHTHSIGEQRSGNEASGYGAKWVSGFKDRLITEGAAGNTTLYTITSLKSSHSHTVTPAGTVSSSFTGTNANLSSAGSTTAFNVQNPYITVYIWKRKS